MAANDLVNSTNERSVLERPFEPEAHCDIVGWIAGIELVEVPETLLPDRRRKDEDVVLPRLDGAVRRTRWNAQRTCHLLLPRRSFWSAAASADRWVRCRSRDTGASSGS